MISAEHFHTGLPYDEFLNVHGGDVDRRKWLAAYDAISLSDSQQQLLSSFVREMRILCFAGAWCGDCVQQCPILRRFEQASSQIKLRFIDRDANAELKEAMGLCGAPRVPQVVVFSEEDFFITRIADRTLTRYREMAATLQGAGCSTGIVSGDDPVMAGIIQDWLDELEHAQLILRTSARLREKHGD